MRGNLHILLVLLLCTMSFAPRAQSGVERIDELINEAEALIGTDPGKLDSLVGLLLHYSKDSDNAHGLTMAYMYDGISSAMKNDFGPALQSFQNAWHLSVETGDTLLQVNSLTNMAGVHKYAGQPFKAQEKLSKAIDLLSKPGWSLTRANTFLALSIIQEELGELSKAEQSIKRAMAIADSAKNVSLYVSCAEQLGALLERQQRYQDALKVYRFALNGRNRGDEAGMMASLYRRMGAVYMRIDDYHKAEKYLERSLVISDSVQNMLAQDSTLVKLIQVTATLGNVAKTNYYAHRLVSFHKAQEAKHVDETLASLETEYLLNEQKLENRALKAESEQAKLMLSRSRIILFGMLSLLVLLAIIVAISWAYMRRVRRFNEELEDKVRLKTAEVLARNERIRDTSFQLAHELRSSVSTVIGAKNLLDHKGIPEGLDHELYEAIGASCEQMDVTLKAMIKTLDEEQVS